MGSTQRYVHGHFIHVNPQVTTQIYVIITGYRLRERFINNPKYVPK